MKTSKKILALSVAASVLMLNNSYALTTTPPVQQVAQVKVAANTPMTLNVVNTPAAVQPAQSVGSGNTFEKEVTPLLREISKKRSALDIRKLDRELEKLDEDAAKAQAEKEKSALTLQITAQNAQAPIPKSAPTNIPSQAMPSEVRVLMIYGYQQNLFAKITMGKEGGYPIRKGDILPDGRLVTNIQANFIEVKSGMGKKSNVERIFVTGPVDTSAPTAAAPANFNGSSSMSMVPLTPSSALPAVSGPTSMVLLPKVVPAKN